MLIATQVSCAFFLPFFLNMNCGWWVPMTPVLKRSRVWDQPELHSETLSQTTLEMNRGILFAILEWHISNLNISLQKPSKQTNKKSPCMPSRAHMWENVLNVNEFTPLNHVTWWGGSLADPLPIMTKFGYKKNKVICDQAPQFLPLFTICLWLTLFFIFIHVTIFSIFKTISICNHRILYAW